MGAEGNIHVYRVKNKESFSELRKNGLECYYHENFIGIEGLNIATSYYGENSWYDEWGNLNATARLYRILKESKEEVEMMSIDKALKHIDSTGGYHMDSNDFAIIKDYFELAVWRFISLYEEAFEEKNSGYEYEVWT